MKFKIERVTRVSQTNIFGRPIEEETKYYIYRSFLFGLRKKYLWFERKSFFEDPEDNRYYVFYFNNRRNATSFSTEEDAQKMLNDIYNYPDDFIRILDKECSKIHQCSTILEHIK